MPTVEIYGQDVDFPDSMTKDELNSAVSKAAQQLGTQSEPTNPIKKAWNALKIPEQMSSSGLNQLASMVPKPDPTGNLPMDIIKGTPRIAAETLAKTAPGFVSRGSLVASAAIPALKLAAPAVRALGRGLGSQLEEASGIAPKAKGALQAVFNDPNLLTEKGVEEAGQTYNAAKEAAGSTARLTTELTKTLGKIPDNNEVVSKAMELAEAKDLNPSEAQLARKAVDAMWKSKQYPKEVIDSMRTLFDNIAKSDQGISAADSLYARAVKASVLRNFLPQNKYGGTSAFKTLLLLFGGGNPLKTVADVTLFSPAVQGGASAALGGAARQIANPLMNSRALSAALMNILKSKNYQTQP